MLTIPLQIFNDDNDDYTRMFYIVIFGICAIIFLINVYIKFDKLEKMKLVKQTEELTLKNISDIKIHQKLNYIIEQLDKQKMITTNDNK